MVSVQRVELQTEAKWTRVTLKTYLQQAKAAGESKKKKSINPKEVELIEVQKTENTRSTNMGEEPKQDRGTDTETELRTDTGLAKSHGT